MASNTKLSDDYIRMVLSMDATEAEQELHKVTKETQQFKEAQKSLNQELKQAQTNPKKNAKLIKQLKEQIKGYTSSIELNKQKMKQLDRQMGLSNLSMTQLRRHLSDLNKQLNNVSQKLHPEEWKKLNDEILVTKGRINELNAESAILNKNSAVKTTALGNLFSSMALKIGSGLKELTAEGIKMAESADGVQRAFNKLNDPGLLDKLRAATKGTVNDLQLMQAAVRAKDFRIPLDDLGKYLAYAQLKAQETGQSVEYLTDSIIMGLGRQSKQILDNLGLSAAEISEEVAKTGDFVSGVTAIVDRQLAEAGDTYVSAADRAAAATVEWENAQLRLGQALIPVVEIIDNLKIKGANLLSLIIEHRAAVWSSVTALLTLASAFVKVKTATEATTKVGKVFYALMATGQTVIKAVNLLLSVFTLNLGKIKTAFNALKAAFMTNPIGLLLTLLASAISALIAFSGRTKDATESMSVMERVSKRMSESENEQIKRVKTLTERLHDNTLGYDKRNAALKELEHLVPEYHATLTKEGKLINENTSALNAYTDALEKEAEAKAIDEELTELTKSRLDLERQKKKLESVIRAGNDNHKDRKKLKEVKKDLETVIGEIKELKNQAKSLAKTGAEEPKSLIEKLKARKKEVELWDESTEELIAIKNRELEKIDEEINRLNNLGKAVRDTTTIIQESRNKLSADQQRLDDATRDSYQQMLDEKIISQEEFDALMAMAAVKSAETRLKLEQEQAAKITAMSFKTEQDRVKAIDEASKHVSDAEHSLANARIKEQQTLNKNIDQLIKSGAKGQELTLDLQEEAELTALDVYLKAALQMVGDDTEKANATWEAYWDAVFGISHKYAEKREKEMASTRKGLGLVFSEEELQQQLKELKDAFDKKYITEEEYQKKSLQLTIESEKARRDAVGLSTYKQDLQLRLMALKEALDQGLLMENEYNAKVRDAKVSSWKEQFDYFSNLAASTFESLQQAEIDNSAAKYDILISQARKAGQDTTVLEEEKEAKQLEIQKKYADVNFAVKASQIIADTAVAIMQAYGQLGPIAGTVAAVLMGVVGAAQLASANAERQRVKQLQVGSSSSSSSSGANTRVLTGHEKGGYLNVQRKQDGKLFRKVPVEADRRGYIDRPTVIVGEGPQSKEFVASNAAVENPTVAPLLNIIDAAQMAGNIRTLDMNREIQARMIGRATGGSIDENRHHQSHVTNSQSPVMGSYGTDTLERLDETLRSLQRDGIPASVTLNDIDRKRELRDRVRSIGKKR